MAVKKKPFTKLVCEVCKRMNYLTRKSKDAAEIKLEFRKFCKFCKKTTLHKEGKK